MGNWVSILSGWDGLPCVIRFIDKIILGFFRQNSEVGYRINLKSGRLQINAGGVLSNLYGAILSG